MARPGSEWPSDVCLAMRVASAVALRGLNRVAPASGAPGGFSLGIGGGRCGVVDGEYAANPAQCQLQILYFFFGVLEQERIKILYFLTTLLLQSSIFDNLVHELPYLLHNLFCLNKVKSNCLFG